MLRRLRPLVFFFFIFFCLCLSRSAAGNTEIRPSNIETLKSLNWTIYTDPESLVKRDFVRYMAADTIRFAWSSNDQNIRQSFSDEEKMFDVLLDENLSNDELKCIMITEDEFAYMVVFSGSETSGWVDQNDVEHRRIYIAEKKLNPSTAAALADIRGVVMVFRAKERPLFGVPGVEYLLNPFSNGH